METVDGLLHELIYYTGADVGCRIQRKSDFRILLFTFTLYKLQDTELLTYPHHCSRPMLLKSQRLKIFTV